MKGTGLMQKKGGLLRCAGDNTKPEPFKAKGPFAVLLLVVVVSLYAAGLVVIAVSLAHPM